LHGLLLAEHVSPELLDRLTRASIGAANLAVVIDRLVARRTLEGLAGVCGALGGCSEALAARDLRDAAPDLVAEALALVVLLDGVDDSVACGFGVLGYGFAGLVGVLR